MTPLNNLPDYSGLDVGDGLPDHLADPVDVPGTRPGMGVRQEGRCRPGSPGSRRPAGGAPGSKRLRRSWPGSPTAPGEPPGGASWKAAASRTAGMTTPPRRGSPARSSSAGWPRPEPPLPCWWSRVVRGWASRCGHDVLPLYVDDPGGVVTRGGRAPVTADKGNDPLRVRSSAGVGAGPIVHRLVLTHLSGRRQKDGYRGHRGLRRGVFNGLCKP